jgi:hypothetical protein
VTDLLRPPSTHAPAAEQRRQIVNPDDPPQPLAGLARVVIGLLLVAAATRVFFVFVSEHYMGRAQAVIDGGGLMDRLRLHNAALQLESAVDLELITLVLAGAVFIAWFARAYKNLGRTGLTDLRYPESWSILMWFVPAGNLIWPKAIANDIRRAGRPQAVRNPACWHMLSVSSLVHVWWGDLDPPYLPRLWLHADRVPVGSADQPDRRAQSPSAGPPDRRSRFHRRRGCGGACDRLRLADDSTPRSFDRTTSGSRSRPHAVRAGVMLLI